MVKKFFQHSYFLLFLIICIGIFFRFYQLGVTPAGLINDEADTGYDAYSLLLTGHDQWNTFLPLVSMKGFGDYRPALYTYLVIGSEKLFGLNTFAVRFPSALFGIISIIFIFLIGRKLFSKEIGLVSVALLAVSPWAIGMSRVGIESNVAIAFTLIGVCAFLYAKKHLGYMVLGIVFFMLAFYTYAAYTLFIPIAGIAVLLFWRKTLPLSKKTILLSVLLLFILIAPFLVSKSTATTRVSQVGFFNSLDTVGLTTVLNDQIGACWNGFPSFVCKFFLNKPFLFASVYIKNYFSHFSPEFLYTSGSQTQFAILPARGLEYLLEALFAVTGVFAIVSRKKKEGIFILTLLFLSVIPDALTGIGHYSRATVMIPFLLLIEAYGAWYIIVFCKTTVLKKTVVGTFLVIFLVSIGGFWVTYTTYFRQQYASYSQYGYKDLMENINVEKNNYDAIYLSRHLNDTKQYIYYLFFNGYDPKLFQKKVGISYSQGSDGWVSIDRVGKIFFVPSVPTSAQTITEKRHILIISNPIDFPKSVPAVFLIKDLQGNVIFMAVDSSSLQKYYKTYVQTENI